MKDFNTILEEINVLYTNNKIPQDMPTVIFVCGQNGSDITLLERIALQNIGGNAVLCSRDNFKKFHPHFLSDFAEEFCVQEVNEFTLVCEDSLLKEAIENRFNIVYKCDLSSYNHINDSISKFHFSGYKVIFYLLAFPEEISLLNLKLKESIAEIFNIIIERTAIFKYQMNCEAIESILEGIAESKVHSFDLYGNSIKRGFFDDYGIYLIGSSKKKYLTDFFEESKYSSNTNLNILYKTLNSKLVQQAFK